MLIFRCIYTGWQFSDFLAIYLGKIGLGKMGRLLENRPLILCNNLIGKWMKLIRTNFTNCFNSKSKFFADWVEQEISIADFSAKADLLIVIKFPSPTLSLSLFRKIKLSSVSSGLQHNLIMNEVNQSFEMRYLPF